VIADTVLVNARLVEDEFTDTPIFYLSA